MNEKYITAAIPAYPQQTAAKPRMLCFQADYDYIVASHHEPLIHKINRGLRNYFNLTVINESCDFSEQVEQHRPDIVLFDGTFEALSPRKIEIKNTNSHKAIPRIGFVRIDALSPSRANFLSEMEAWGVDTFFTNVDTAMGESFSEISDRLFYWPMFIDPDVFHDYGITKNIPVLMVGNFDGPIPSQYNWRVKVREPLMTNLPCLYHRHPGWDPKKLSPLALYGEELAKTINSAWFTPTCGAMKKIVVSKHIEFPGAGACLVTEETPALRAFGFKDGVNCIFTDEKRIVARINELLANKEMLKSIISGGYELVHRNHTFYHRPQILQWLQLKRGLAPGHKIVQPDLFGNLQAVSTASSLCTHHITGSTDTALTRAGNANLFAGRIGEARYFFEELLRYVPYYGEAEIGLGLCDILEGRADHGVGNFGNPIAFGLDHGGFEPDPMEWAFLLIGLLCCEKGENALDYAQRFMEVQRPELTAARWAVFTALGHHNEAQSLIARAQSPSKERATYHGTIPRFTLKGFVDFAIKMLSACKQDRMASDLRARQVVLPD